MIRPKSYITPFFTGVKKNFKFFLTYFDGYLMIFYVPDFIYKSAVCSSVGIKRNF